MQNVNVVTPASAMHASRRAAFARAAAVSAYASDVVMPRVRPLVAVTRCGTLTIDTGGGSDG